MLRIEWSGGANGALRAIHYVRGRVLVVYVQVMTHLSEQTVTNGVRRSCFPVVQSWYLDFEIRDNG